MRHACCNVSTPYRVLARCWSIVKKRMRMDSRVREAHISSKWAGGQTHLTWSCPRLCALNLCCVRSRSLSIRHRVAAPPTRYLSAPAAVRTTQRSVSSRSGPALVCPRAELLLPGCVGKQALDAVDGRACENPDFRKGLDLTAFPPAMDFAHREHLSL